MKIDKIKEICSKPNIFISFRDSVNVSLINPKNIYGTPTGVYSYPAIDFLPKIKECDTISEFLEIFPYKGRNDPAFVYFYKLNPESTYLDNNATFEDIKPFYQKLIDMYEGKGAFFKRILDNVKKYVNKEEEKVDPFWGDVMKYDIFSGMIYDIRKDKTDSEVHKLWTLTYHISDDDVARWSNILRKLGIDAFVDHGEGYIHTNEPIQAVLLSPKMFNNFEIMQIDDLTAIKNEIRKALEEGEWLDGNKLDKIYKRDPNWVLNIFLIKVKKGDYGFINDHAEFMVMNKDNRIVTNILQIFIDHLKDLKMKRIDDKLIKLCINKFGDDFIKKYIDAWESSGEEIHGLGETEDLTRKIIVGSLMYANKEKTLEFFRRNKDYNYWEEIEFLHDDPKLIKKHKSINSYYFGDVKFGWEQMIADDDPVYKASLKDIEHKYELFKDTYEKTTGVAWDFNKFKQRSENWKFYGDYNGYIAVRPQASGYYKLVGSAGDFKSVMRGLNELMQEEKPVWGMMTKDLADVLVKRYNFYMPPKALTKMIFNLIKPKTFGDAQIKIEDDGGFMFDYEDTGTSKKYFVGNKKYYQELLDNEYINKNKVIRKFLQFFVNRLK